MARVIKQKVWEDGDVLTPHEINAEVSAILGEFNGNLDRDNFNTGLLTSAKFKEFTFNNIEKLKGTGTPTIQVLARLNQQPKLTSIPSEASTASDPMQVTMQTSDGALQIEGSVNWTHYPKSDGTGNYYSPHTVDRDVTGHAGQAVLCIVVDGKIVARSGTNTPLIQQHRYVSAYVPVGAGTHQISLEMFIFTGRDSVTPTQSSTTLNADHGVKVTFKERTLWVRNVKR